MLTALQGRNRPSTVSERPVSSPSWHVSVTCTHLKSIRVSFYFVLVPLKDIHLPYEPQNYQRNQNDIIYPKLDVLIQNFLDINDRVAPADVIDCSVQSLNLE